MNRDSRRTAERQRRLRIMFYDGENRTPETQAVRPITTVHCQALGDVALSDIEELLKQNREFLASTQKSDTLE
ncbi:MAG: hypothetical protein ACYCPS_04235 [Candidatus Saccharimonadales bacterium]